MSDTIAARGAAPEQQTAVGVIIIGTISVLSAILVIAGLGYAAGTGGRHQAALAAGGCEPNLSPSGLQCTTVQVLSAQYTQITTPTAQQLNTDAAAYAASELRNRAAAASALTAEVTVEDEFGHSLAAFPFPPASGPAARTLEKANQALVALTTEQSKAPLLFQMRSLNGRVAAARAAVQADIAALAKVLGTPPTASQEP